MLSRFDRSSSMVSIFTLFFFSKLRVNLSKSLFGSLTQANIFAPNLAKSSSAALPIPLLEPVIITFFFLKNLKTFKN